MSIISPVAALKTFCCQAGTRRLPHVYCINFVTCQDDTTDFHHMQGPYLRWEDDLVSFNRLSQVSPRGKNIRHKKLKTVLSKIKNYEKLMHWDLNSRQRAFTFD